MSLDQSKTRKLSERDLDFLVDTVSPEVADKPHLKQIIREDEDFRNTFMGDAKVFHRVMRDDEILFILGVFPVYAERYHRYPVSGQIRPGISGFHQIMAMASISTINSGLASAVTSTQERAGGSFSK